MSKEDSHSVTFNVPSNIGSTLSILILFPEDYKFWVLHFENYVLGIELMDLAPVKKLQKEYTSIPK